jgi:galactan endo-1,6-beta-galactosidase
MPHVSGTGPTLGTKRLWMSEYGDNDGSGMALAQTIIEDLTYLKPTAWIYWQPAEPSSTWGLVNGNYGSIRTLSEPGRGAPTWVYDKYYVMAQFTRFLRPGYKILGSTDHNTVACLRCIG